VYDTSLQYETGGALDIGFNGQELNTKQPGNPGTWAMSSLPISVWSTYLPVTSARYAASTLTPGSSIIVTRIQARAVVPPTSCTTNAEIEISDGTTLGTGNLVVVGAESDSGPIGLSFKAGAPVIIGVGTAAGGCQTSPSSVNLVVQYVIP
jgi:hypothetical protein